MPKRNENFGSQFFGGLADILQNAPGLYNRINAQKYDQSRISNLDAESQRRYDADIAYRNRRDAIGDERYNATQNRLDVKDQANMLANLEEAQRQQKKDELNLRLRDAQIKEILARANNYGSYGKLSRPQAYKETEDARKANLNSLMDEILNRMQQNNPDAFASAVKGNANPYKMSLSELLSLAGTEDYQLKERRGLFGNKSSNIPLLSALNDFLWSDKATGIDPYIKAKGDTATYYNTIPTMTLMEKLQNGEPIGPQLSGGQQGGITPEEAIAELKRRGEL